MKKSIIFIILMPLMAGIVMAGMQADGNNPVFKVHNAGNNKTIVACEIQSYSFSRVETPRGLSLVVHSPGAQAMLQQGAPDLPFISFSLAIPDMGAWEAVVDYGDSEIVENIEIAPSKGSLMRNIDPAQVPYIYGNAYQTDAFWPEVPVDAASDPFILRDFRGVSVFVYPFRYNPVTRQLQVYNNITIHLRRAVNKLPVNEFARNRMPESIDGDFMKLYNGFFVNLHQNPLKYTALEEGTPGKILILAKDIFMAEMADYIHWKTEKGHEVQMLDIAEVGTTANAIKTWLQNYYNETGFTYLLLVGDAQHIPSMVVSSADSDNAYAYVAGSDGYADYFVGRFSGESTNDIATQVQRVVNYEKNMLVTDTWLGNALGSASNEGAGIGHDGGESDVQHLNNIRTRLEDYGYTVSHVNQDGGSNALISTALNLGQGLVNYIGHGSDISWGNTNYSSTQVNQLLNENKLPFIFSVACVNGNFRGQTCFAETWMRASKNGNPTGALAFIGSTINQSWAEPMTAQDEMNNVLIEMYENNIKRTFAGVSYAGFFKMIEAGGQGQSMADTWTVFGDPSVVLRTKTPEEMTIAHNDFHVLSATQFELQCDAEGALAALSQIQDEQVVLLGYAYVSNGTATIEIPEFDNVGEMKLTVTAFNTVSYQSDVLIIAPEGPYVVWNGYEINDAAANNNAMADYNETFLVNASIRNVGVEDAFDVVVGLSAENQWVTIDDNVELFGDVAASNEKSIESAFAISVADGVPDQTTVNVQVQISDGSQNIWNNSFNLKLNAPLPELHYLGIDDSETGNDNGLLDPGETALVRFTLKNTGHADALAGNLDLELSGPAIADTYSIEFDVLQAGTESPIAFEVTINSDVDGVVMLDFDLAYHAGMYAADLEISLPVGIQIEDWESGNIVSYAWQNDASYPWALTQEGVYQGNYCLRSGALPSSGGESKLSILLDVVAAGNLKFYKKVSCEGMSWGQYWDYLAFSIDNQMQAQWAGIVDWAEHSYQIGVGSHELKWTYVKDAYISQGSDCAWLDFITLPPHSNVVYIEQLSVTYPEINIRLYPSPADDYLSMVFELPTESEVTIEIYSISGTQVRTVLSNRKLDSGRAELHLSVSDLPQGYYFVRSVLNGVNHVNQFTIVR